MFSVVLVVFLLFTSLISFHQSGKKQRSENAIYHLVAKRLKSQNFPANSQIAIIGTHGLGYGLWPRTDGIVKSMTGRIDLTGIMPIEYHFYNPFNGHLGRDWNLDLRMTGLLHTDPIFIFRYQLTENWERLLVPVSYGLQWYKDEKWALHHFDKENGSHHIIARGVGREQYQLEVEKLIRENGITLADIAWGGYQL